VLVAKAAAARTTGARKSERGENFIFMSFQYCQIDWLAAEG
jgi:hypothetical protein